MQGGHNNFISFPSKYVTLYYLFKSTFASAWIHELKSTFDFEKLHHILKCTPVIIRMQLIHKS